MGWRPRRHVLPASGTAPFPGVARPASADRVAGAPTRAISGGFWSGRSGLPATGVPHPAGPRPARQGGPTRPSLHRAALHHALLTSVRPHGGVRAGREGRATPASWWILLCLEAVVLWTSGNLVKPFAVLVPVGPVLVRAEVRFAALHGMWLWPAWATFDRLQLLSALAFASGVEAVVQMARRGRVRGETRKPLPRTGAPPQDMSDLLPDLDPFRGPTGVGPSRPTARSARPDRARTLLTARSMRRRPGRREVHGASPLQCCRSGERRLRPGPPASPRPRGGPDMPAWIRRLARRPSAPAPAEEPDKTPPLRGLAFAFRTIAGVSPALLGVMLAGRFFAALVPAAQLWVQRDLLDDLAAALPGGAALGGPGAGPGAAGLLPLLVGLVALNATAFALGAASRAAEGHLREWVGHAIARRHHEVVTGANLEEFERPRFWDRAQRTWNGSVIVETLDGTLDFLASMVNLVATAGVLLRVRWEIAPIVVLGAVPTLWASLANNRENVAFYRRTQPRQRRVAMLANLLTDAAAALELRLFDLGVFLRLRWRTEAEAQQREQFALLRSQRPRGGIAALWGLAAFGLAFATVAAALAHGRAGIGDVTLVVEAIPAVQGLIAGMLGGAAHLSYSGQYAADTSAFFATARADEGAGRRPFPRPVREGIRFEGVSFTYPETSAPVLQEVDLFIPAGQALAVVGRNGAGKTTLIKLLLGIYRPTAGRITVDGVDLSAYDPDDLRRNLAAVFQDFTRFHVTLRENVAFGFLPSLADDRAVQDVLERVGLGDLASGLEGGLDTILSKAYADGAELSGGQWQRIAIARALIRPAQVVVLDEPTAALDPVAEVEVFRHFRALATGRTTLLISHRLGVARLAERIAVISAGRVRELGSHAELMAQGGEYAAMFRLQSRAYAAAPAGGR